MLHHKVLNRINRMLIGALFIVGAIATLIVAELVEDNFMPIKGDVTVLSSYAEDGDVWLSLSAVKKRRCSYLPPPRARTFDGHNLVVLNKTPLATVNWETSDSPQFAGPWRVIGGDKQQFKVYQEFRCHIFWTQFQDMLTVDARGDLVRTEVVK